MTTSPSSLLTPDTTVRDALRLRPRLADNLAAFGAEPWERSHATLHEIFRNRDTLERFLEHAHTLAVPTAPAPWMELPASHLADHLTQNHRDFFHLTIPEIMGYFNEWNSLDPEIVDRREEFEDFVRVLRHEVDSEEAEFFPRVLRYEACLRDPSVNPEFNGGSLKVAVAYRRSRAPLLQPERLGRIAARLREAHAVKQGDTWGELLAARLEDFHMQFIEHERLESDVLYPIALDMEKTLYNLSISGLTRGVGSQDPAQAGVAA